MKRFIGIILVLTLLLSVGCKKKTPVVIETPTEPEVVEEVETKLPETIESTVEAAKPQPSKQHPLFEDRRPIAFMINNHPEAQPQSGWSHAKIAYEILVEGNLTRILLISDAETGVVGPIRSARPAFFEVAAEYQPIYSHVGNYEYVQESPMQYFLIDFDQFFHGGYYRTAHRYAPHNLYGSMEGIYAAAQAEGHSLDLPEDGLGHFEIFDKAKVYEGGTPVTNISFTYDGAQQLNFRYDPDKQAYIKSINGVDVIDETTGELLEIANYIILERPHGKMPNGIHEYVDYLSDGTARLFIQGQEFALDYHKPAPELPMEFRLDGELLVLNPGFTFINVVPTGMPITATP